RLSAAARRRPGPPRPRLWTSSHDRRTSLASSRWRRTRPRHHANLQRRRVPALPLLRIRPPTRRPHRPDAITRTCSVSRPVNPRFTLFLLALIGFIVVPTVPSAGESGHRRAAVTESAKPPMIRIVEQNYDIDPNGSFHAFL